MENSSISASASSTAFMPLVQRTLPQNTQSTWVTHLFLKFAFDVDMADQTYNSTTTLPEAKRALIWIQTSPLLSTSSVFRLLICSVYRPLSLC